MNLSFTPRDLRICIKSGCTPEDLCSRYGCTDEKLRAHIAKIYQRGKEAQKIYKSLEGNRKIAHKKQVAETPVVPDSSETVNATEETENSNSDTLTLSELEDKEQSLSCDLMSIETKRKELLAEHANRIEDLRNIQSELGEIQASLKSCRERYDQVVREANEIAVQINREINPVLKETKVALETVRHEIETKKTVSLFVFADGRIEAQDRPDLILEDDGYLELKDELLCREECQDLRIRDVTTLARLLKISEHIDHLELACENEELEAAFALVRGKI